MPAIRPTRKGSASRVWFLMVRRTVWSSSDTMNSTRLLSRAERTTRLLAVRPLDRPDDVVDDPNAQLSWVPQGGTAPRIPAPQAERGRARARLVRSPRPRPAAMAAPAPTREDLGTASDRPRGWEARAPWELVQSRTRVPAGVCGGTAARPVRIRPSGVAHRTVALGSVLTSACAGAASLARSRRTATTCRRLERSSWKPWSAATAVTVPAVAPPSTPTTHAGSSSHASIRSLVRRSGLRRHRHILLWSVPRRPRLVALQGHPPYEHQHPSVVLSGTVRKTAADRKCWAAVIAAGCPSPR